MYQLAVDLLRPFVLLHLACAVGLVLLWRRRREGRRRRPYASAAECARLLGERGSGRVVLVTDATRLARAEGCFRKQGLDVVPCGCRYRAHRWTGSAADYLPDPAAAAGLQAAWH